MVDLWLDTHRSTSAATRAKNEEPKNLGRFLDCVCFMIL